MIILKELEAIKDFTEVNVLGSAVQKQTLR